MTTATKSTYVPALSFPCSSCVFDQWFVPSGPDILQREFLVVFPLRFPDFGAAEAKKRRRRATLPPASTVGGCALLHSAI